MTMLAAFNNAVFVIFVLPVLYFAYTCSGGFFDKVFGDAINTFLFLSFGMPAGTFVLCLLFSAIRKIFGIGKK